MKQSGLGIASLILGIIGLLLSCLIIGVFPSFIGLVLAIIALTQKDVKHGTAIGGLVCSVIGIGIFLFMFFVIGTSSSDTTSDAETKNREVKLEVSTEETENIQSDIISVGGSFTAGNFTISVNDCDTNFTDYEDPYGWNKPKDGMKYVMVSFTFKNAGDSDAYVSIYDFSCYADDTSCEQIYSLDDDSFIYENLSSGRNVSFKTYYTVPKDAQSIELEYEVNMWTSEKIIIKIQ